MVSKNPETTESLSESEMQKSVLEQEKKERNLKYWVDYRKNMSKKEKERLRMNVRLRCADGRYKRNKISFIRYRYNSQKYHSKKRFGVFPEYTIDELINWCMNQKIFHVLHKKWVDSNFNKNLTPSIDRIESLGIYELNNIQIVTWKENLANGHKQFSRIQGKEVAQYTINGKLLKKYDSVAEAGRINNIPKDSIYNSANPNRKAITACGFIWKYTGIEHNDRRKEYQNKHGAVS